MDWQGFASQLVALLLPDKTWGLGEFEKSDKAALLAECREAAKTDVRLEALAQDRLVRLQRRNSALAKLSQAEREALGV